MSKPLRVLIIEDSADDLEPLLRALERGDFSVTHQRVATSAELRAALGGGPWHIALSNYALPELSAPAALALVRGVDPDLPFVVISGAITEEAASDLLRVGANDYLPKHSLVRLSSVVERELLAAGQRRAQRAEAAAIRQLAALVQSSDDAIIGRTLDGVIRSWNPAAEKLFGWPADEALGKPIDFLIPPPKAGEQSRIMAQIQAGERVASLDTERLRKDGTTLTISLTVSPVLDHDGTQIGTSEIVRDLTESQRTAALLSRDAHILANVRDSVIVTDLQGTVTYWNDGATRLFGWSAAELLGRPLLERFPEPVRARIAAEIQSRTAGTEWIGEFEDYHKDGSRVWIEARITRITDAAGQPVGLLALAHDISERKWAEEALRQSEAEYRALAENLPQLVWMTDALGEAQYVNQRFVEYTGIPRAEGLTSGWGHVIPPEEWPAVRDRWRDSVQTGNPFEMECRMRRADGACRWHLARGVPVRDEAGVLLRWVVTSTDIEEQIRERLAQAQLVAVLEASDDMIISTTLDGIVQTWNSGAERILGYSAAEMVGQPLYRVGPPGDEASPVSLIARVVAGESIREITTTRIRKDGKQVTLSLSLSPIRDQEGRIVCVSGISRDITEALRMHQERDALLERLRLYLERMPLACVTTTPEGSIQAWNPAAERIFGYRAEEVIGKSYPELQLFADSTRTQRDSIRTRLLAGAMDAHLACECVNKAGETLFCEWYNTPLLDAEGVLRGLLFMATDATEKRQLEAQLRQSQKMEAFGQLAGGVAHDFNNMLAVISGYCEIAQTNLPAGHSLHGYLDEIQKASARAAGLTRQLLAFSRRQVLDPKVTDLRQTVLQLGMMLRRLIGEDIELVTQSDPQAAWVKADPGQLEQVIVNLVVNARDAMPTGGTLTVGIQRVELNSTTAATVHGAEPGPYVRLSVQDTGSGIAPETLPRIFEPFFTTKDLGKGTGLGLSTVHGIVSQSGGYLQLESTVGTGTTFSIYLPHVAAPLSAETGVTSPVLPRGAETILVVEDEPQVRALVVDMLRQAGYTVLEAPQAEAALQLEAQYAGTIHLLLTDVVMPHLGGPLLAQLMVSRRPGLAVLLMSGYTDDAVIRHGVLAGDIELLQKPFGTRDLTERVRRTLDQQRWKDAPGVILVVDDEADQRESLAEVLRDAGYVVLTASDGAEALTQLRKEPRPGLVLFDLVMSGMNGWVFRQEQRKDPALRDIPAVLLSGHADPGTAAAYLEVQEFLRKPVDVEKLLEVVRQHLSPRPASPEPCRQTREEVR